jgi:hypothetical protein
MGGDAMRRREPWIRQAFSPYEEGSRSFGSEDRWITAGEDSSTDGRLWDQYAVLVDLYKFYIDMTWKVSVGYYAAAGVALAYYFNNKTAPGNPGHYVLAFFSVVSLGLGYIQWRGARDLRLLARWLEYIAYTLRLPGRPHVEFAMVYLLLSGCAAVVISAAGAVLLLIG